MSKTLEEIFGGSTTTTEKRPSLDSIFNPQQSFKTEPEKPTLKEQFGERVKKVEEIADIQAEGNRR